MRLTGVLGVVLAAALGLYWVTGSGNASGDRVIEYSKGDMTMNDAQQEAQRHLDDFLGMALDRQGVAASGMLVKVAFETSIADKTEVIWVGPFGRNDEGTFVGILANAPVDIPSASPDGRVAFDKTMIRDWMFPGKDGKLYGSYTTRAMLGDLDPKMAAQLSATLSEDPLPSRW